MSPITRDMISLKLPLTNTIGILARISSRKGVSDGLVAIVQAVLPIYAFYELSAESMALPHRYRRQYGDLGQEKPSLSALTRWWNE